jgi:uncharacterized protein (DUF697 family)
MDWSPRGLKARKTLVKAIESGLTRAYSSVKLDSAAYLQYLRRAHRLPVESADDMFHLPVVALDHVAEQTIKTTRKIAALEGAGVGMGGLLTVLPDMSFLAVVAMRMLQKLSLIYGFDYATDDEIVQLWIAAATAAGVDLGRDLIEKEVVERFVPRVVERVAAKLGVEIAEKWTARLIPVVSGAIGATLNYYFIKEWGRRAQAHFRARHLHHRRMASLPEPYPLRKPLLPA